MFPTCCLLIFVLSPLKRIHLFVSLFFLLFFFHSVDLILLLVLHCIDIGLSFFLFFFSLVSFFSSFFLLLILCVIICTFHLLARFCVFFFSPLSTFLFVSLHCYHPLWHSSLFDFFFPFLFTITFFHLVPSYLPSIPPFAPLSSPSLSPLPSIPFLLPSFYTQERYVGFLQ